MTIKDLNIGQTGTVISVGGNGELRQHFLDMGITPNTEITLIKYAPMGDPIELRLRDYELTLRIKDAEKISILPMSASSNISKYNNVKNKTYYKYNIQSEFGERNRYHVKSTNAPLSEGTILTFALAGNQNCGKTTLFNQLTGSNQHVGNFPGVTVDRKSGCIKGQPETEITDLPGIYSMSPYSSEEIITRQFIINEKPKGIINIVDASNIERNLYLTMQLMELDIPMVLALNMMDEIQENGGFVDIGKMEDMLGIPVIPISALKNKGIDELTYHAIHAAKYQERPMQTDFFNKFNKNEHKGSVHQCLNSIMNLIKDHALIAEIPIRFAAAKIAEGDSDIMDMLKLSQKEKDAAEQIIAQMEYEKGLDRAAAIADMRFSFIDKLVSETVIKPRESKEHARSRFIDKFLTGKYTAIPAFIGIMGLVFFLTFNVIGAWLQEMLETIIDKITITLDNAMTGWNVNAVIQSLIIDGIFSGVGSVLSFLPVIVTLFFFLSLLEDTGYMARAAFIMDKLLRKIGLSGRSIVPMLIGFGCTVPAIMSSRTLPSERDRKMTVILTPFMSCTAKLPIYAFISSLFFPNFSWLIMIGLYIFGIIIGIITALLMKKSTFKGSAVPFVMELPNYRIPGIKNTVQLLWEKSKDFLQKAFTVIFMATIIIWFLQTFNMHFQMVSDSKDSMLASIAGFISPIFKPLGFADWRISTSLIAGVMAKESVVSTLIVLFGTSEGILAAISPMSALPLMIFCLLYTPCVAAIAAIKRELGLKWAVWVVLEQCIIAWLCAFIFRIICILVQYI